ncbi:hypothetical protein GGI02_003783 [Coemansia sp. RSA 2322]|nr:hypothetical protein GGI02_003783 [Coemansia sp. RSA 2322]
MIDERDENFREMAALGNIKAVRAYIRSGVDTDGQNKMNGWTALHWACARGQADTVETLLRAGASTSIRNNKGHSALDVCKSESIRALFSSYVRNGESIGSDEEVSAQGDRTAAISAGLDGSFVPNYLANPDLMKTWGMPEDLLPPTQ